MTTRNRNFALLTGILLAAGAIPAESSHAADSLTVTSRPGGFITESERRVPSEVDSQGVGLGSALCARASRNSPRRCPSAVKGAPGFPSSKISAGLPHLRLNILLKEMKNVVVAGSGVDSLGIFQEPWATWKISSAAADVSIPAPAESGFGLPLPPPGETFGEAPYANGLFQGIIHNGCLGAAASFDLKLDSTVIRSSTSEVLGQVHLEDAVNGPGFYTWAYVLRATDEAGNVSDFKFSGDADAYCTTDSELSAGLVGGADITLETVKLAAEGFDSRSASAAEYITQEDIDRAGGHFRIFVADIGDVYITGIRAPTAEKTCRVRVQAVVQALQAKPPTTGGRHWLQLTIKNCAPGVPLGQCCELPTGGGCYIIVYL
jgi:hypothetical protein